MNLDLEHIELGLHRGRPQQESELLAQALRAAGDRSARSSHAYFVCPVDPAAPVLYRVDDCDGASTRRVTALQHGAAILTLMAWFDETEPGATHPGPVTDPPPPEHDEQGRFRFWFRARDACAVAYESHALLRSTGLVGLDHAIWFHERLRADDWLRYELETHSAGPGRALCRGALFDRSGLLVATVVQEVGLAG